MRSLLAALAILLAACASEAPPPDPSLEPAPGAGADDGSADTTPFDAQAWLQEHAAAFENNAEYEENVRLGRAALADLPLDVERACFEWEGEPYEPSDDLPHAYGILSLIEIGPQEVVVEATCSFGAYQGTYAMLHLQGPEIALVEAPEWNPETGALQTHPVLGGFSDYSSPPDRTFSVFIKSRGLGDCGVWTQYRLGEQIGTVEPLEVRERDCDQFLGDEDELPPPDEWPVVWSAS